MFFVIVIYTRSEIMLSAAFRQTNPTPPIAINKELPNINPQYSSNKREDLHSPNKNTKYTFDQMHISCSPPGKNFMINLQSRIKKM